MGKYGMSEESSDNITDLGQFRQNKQWRSQQERIKEATRNSNRKSTENIEKSAIAFMKIEVCMMGATIIGWSLPPAGHALHLAKPVTNILDKCDPQTVSLVAATSFVGLVAYNLVSLVRKSKKSVTDHEREIDEIVDGLPISR
jgi:hypothetical protein